MPKVLIVDDEPQIRRILADIIAEAGFAIAEAASIEEAIVVTTDFKPDVVLLDTSLPDIAGLPKLRQLLNQHREAIYKKGSARQKPRHNRSNTDQALDYLARAFDKDELLLLLNRSLKLSNQSRAAEEFHSKLSALEGFNEIIGISPRLHEVLRAIKKVAPIDTTVLIQGESGTGKELVARAIHRHSQRHKGPFIPVNCGAIPQSLFETEFFGYERGAFTDARETHAGRFEQGQGGIIFLDEIGELPLGAQVKLLRALQDREVWRLGGSKPIKINVRIIAATNINLKTAVERGKFRDDLYWRLNVVKLTLPGLRKRREDISLIIDHTLDRFNRELGLAVRTVLPDARKLLTQYDWPGNVRELENAICSAMIMCEDGVVRVRDLPPRIRGDIDEEDAELTSAAARQSFNHPRLNLADAVKKATARVERKMIISRLTEMNGNRTATAKSLGISRKSLFNKMRQYNLGNEEIEEST